MALLTVLKEREQERKDLRKKALREARKLASLLRRRFWFESLYIVGSLLTDAFSFRSDIDMVIKGLKTEDFFKAHAFLLKESSYKIDLKPFEDLPADFQEEVLRRGMKVE